MIRPITNGPTNSQKAPVAPAILPLPRRAGGAVSAAGAIRVGADMSAEQPVELGVHGLFSLGKIRINVTALADDLGRGVGVGIVHLGCPGGVGRDGVLVEDLEGVRGRARLQLGRCRGPTTCEAGYGSRN